MGTSRWSADTYMSYSNATRSLSRDEIFTQSRAQQIHPDMDPKGLTFRESRYSDANPAATPIIVGIDVTGSMGFIAEHIVKTGLGTMVNEILQRRPVTDPAICFVAIGDVEYDRAPLQVGQFESDIVMASWLEKIWIEGNGGGNDHESYHLPYYFGLHHTRTDAFERDGRPGVIITIGDEEPPNQLTQPQLMKVFGSSPQSGYNFSELIRDIRPMYTPYHIIVAEGHYARSSLDTVQRQWQELLGHGVLTCYEHQRIAQLIVTMLDIDAGRTLDQALGDWPEDVRTSLRRSFSDFAESGEQRLSRRMDA